MDFTESWSDTCSKVGHAAKLGRLDLMKHFIKDNLPVDVADNRGWRPLHEAAAASPNIECLEYLLSHGGTNINWTTHEGETALLLACKRRQGLDANAYVKLLLQHEADPNIVDNEEDSPLLEAIRSGNQYVVEQLIASGADVNATDCSRWSPLHAAATFQDPSLLKCLLNHNALINIQDECGMTPIFTAAQHGGEDCLRELLTVAKERKQEHVVNIGAEDWATPLMIASQQGFVNCVEILLEFDANPDLKTADNATALHLAVQGDNIRCLEILLLKMKLDSLISIFHPLTYQDRKMICPLHLAVEWGSHVSLKALLDAGFSPDSLYDGDNQEITRFINYVPGLETALSYAIYKKDMEAVNMLVAAGASCSPPVDRAFHPLLRAMSIPDSEFFNILIENGTNVNFRRPVGGSNLSNEVFLYSLVINAKYRRLLLYYGCDPNLSFQNEYEIFFFIKCARHLVNSTSLSLHAFITFLLRFLVISKKVIYAFLQLNRLFPESIGDLLDEINRPSTLKQLCTLKLRQHIYSIHGVKLPQMISQLHLPLVLEKDVSYQDLIDEN